MKRIGILAVLVALAGCGGSSSGGTAAPAPGTSADPGCQSVAQAGPVVGDALRRVKDNIDRHELARARSALGEAANAVEEAQRQTSGDLTVALGTLNADLQTWSRMIGQHRWSAATDFLNRVGDDVSAVGAVCP